MKTKRHSMSLSARPANSPNQNPCQKKGTVKTLMSLLSNHLLRTGKLFLLAFLLAVPAAHAGLTLNLKISREGGIYTCYPILSTNSGPAANPGYYEISSPSRAWDWQSQLTSAGMSVPKPLSNTSYNNFDSFSNELAGGPWTIINYVTGNNYMFTVTATGFTSNSLPNVTVTYPTNDAANVTNMPTFAWDGPIGWGGSVAVEDFYSGFDVSGNPSTADTSWTFSTPLTNGPNNFQVDYTQDASSTIVASAPMGIYGPMAGWMSTASLATRAHSHFYVNSSAGGGPTQSNLVLNGGFETGDFTDWTIGGNSAAMFVSTNYAYSGSYGGEFGPVGSPGYLSQTVPTTPGASYLVSFWLDSPDGATPSEFQVSWGGTNLLDATNLPAIGWTNMHFVVTASGTSSALQFGFQDDPGYLGLDDVGISAVESSTPPTIVLGPLGATNATEGSAYSQTISASGGVAPYSFAVTGGSLPGGLTLSVDGLLSGTPTNTGVFNFTVTATDYYGYTGTNSYTLTVSVPTIVLGPLGATTATEGSAYSQTITASGGVPPYTFAVTSGSFPGGLTLVSDGLLYGQPTSTGVYDFTVTATDYNGLTGTNSYTLTVSAPSGDQVNYASDGTNAYVVSSPNATGNIVIASTYDGCPVTSIDNGAFEYCSGLTSVTIPDSVTNIGNVVFEYCSGLTSVTLGNSVTNIGNLEFYECSSLASVTIPDSVNGINDSAFYGCSSLTNVTIGNNVTDIGEYAFYECSSLVSVTIGISVTDIGQYAFDECSNLASVTIPDSVTNIDRFAFNGCSGLTNVTIGNSVTDIGGNAFDYCSGLTSVTIPDSVTNIGSEAFGYCSGLTSVTLDNGVTYIGYGVFEYCSGLTSVVIPDSVTVIGQDAFEYCSGLTSVTIPTSVTTIVGGAFYYCPGLTSVTIPDSVTSIGNLAFAFCSGLTSVAIPNSVTNIGFQPFGYCSDLTNINVDAANPSYASVGGVLFNKSTTVLIQYPEALKGSYTIPTSVTTIGLGAFADCSSLTGVTIDPSVTSIGEEAFYYCYSLTNVVIPKSVTNITGYAFIGCANLTGVYFQGDSLTPNNDLTVFAGDTLGVAYVLPNTTGWGATFDGLPVRTNNIGTIVGAISQVVGNVTVTHTNGTTSALEPGDPVAMGDTINTPAGSAANILFNDNTSFATDENSHMTINQYVYDSTIPSNNSFWAHIDGVFRWVSGLIGKNNPDAEHIETEVGSIGIRGTQFISQDDPCSSTEMIYLIQGELAITPLNTPGVTNICDAPVTIAVTPDSVTTNALDQATYDSVSNQLFQATGVVTFPSWLEQYFGCTNNPDAAPTADPSGDGEDNYSKFLAGMNPTNPASYFHILSATPEGNSVMVSWMCGGGRTNVLQTTTDLSGGWSNTSPNIVLAGSGDSVTNYLDVGAVTNTPARFYRVQLVQ